MQFRRIYNQSETFHIEPVQKSASVSFFLDIVSKKHKRKKELKGSPKARKVKNFSKPLINAAKEANLRLEKKQLPYRFFIYKQNSSVIMEFLILDKNGKTVDSVKKDITDDDFSIWIDDVAGIEGLLVDTVV
ncbi:hypothetical protein CHISP_3199 [Chitinispirillum alkaliphilum]|nr:hypothetical protein CHISP_3199 [Chitinispirillum alkaliphilum]